MRPLGEAAAVLDREQLRNITLADEDLMREVLAVLIDDTGRQIEALQRAVGRQDGGACVRLAHSAKGACANLGAMSSATILQQIERCATCGDFAGCGQSLSSLAAELEKLRYEARAL